MKNENNNYHYNLKISSVGIPKGIAGYNILLHDPLDRYKVIEKEEMQSQKDSENKIQNKDAQNKDGKVGEANEDKISQKPGSEMGGATKKKKAAFEDVCFCEPVLGDLPDPAAKQAGEAEGERQDEGQARGGPEEVHPAGGEP
jgi:hypothetical protein